MSATTCSQPSLPTTGLVGSIDFVRKYIARTSERWAAEVGRFGTPQLSLNGTHAMTQGRLRSRSNTSSHSRVSRPVVRDENSYAAGVSPRTGGQAGDTSRGSAER